MGRGVLLRSAVRQKQSVLGQPNCHLGQILGRHRIPQVTQGLLDPAVEHKRRYPDHLRFRLIGRPAAGPDRPPGGNSGG